MEYHCPAEIDSGELANLSYNLHFDIPAHSDSATRLCSILLQSYFSRKPVSEHLRHLQQECVVTALRLASGLAEVLPKLPLSSEEGSNLKTIVLCLQLAQMCCQGMWTHQSLLLQLPYMTASRIEDLAAKGVTDIADLMNMEDTDRDQALRLSPAEMSELALVCNRQPSMDLSVKATNEASVEVVVRRDIDPSDFEDQHQF